MHTLTKRHTHTHMHAHTEPHQYTHTIGIKGFFFFFFSPGMPLFCWMRSAFSSHPPPVFHLAWLNSVMLLCVVRAPSPSVLCGYTPVEKGQRVVGDARDLFLSLSLSPQKTSRFFFFWVSFVFSGAVHFPPGLHDLSAPLLTGCWVPFNSPVWGYKEALLPGSHQWDAKSSGLDKQTSFSDQLDPPCVSAGIMWKTSGPQLHWLIVGECRSLFLFVGWKKGMCEGLAIGLLKQFSTKLWEKELWIA